MEVRRMQRHFEIWNDMKHEPRKFWSAKTTFFYFMQSYSHTWLATVNHRRPFSDFYLGGGGGVCTQARRNNQAHFITGLCHRQPSNNSAYWQIHTSGLFSYTRLIHVPKSRVTRSADQRRLWLHTRKRLKGTKASFRRALISNNCHLCQRENCGKDEKRKEKKQREGVKARGGGWIEIREILSTATSTQSSNHNTNKKRHK